MRRCLSRRKSSSVFNLNATLGLKSIFLLRFRKTRIIIVRTIQLLDMIYWRFHSLYSIINHLFIKIME
jgi:hypothetical protein